MKRAYHEQQKFHKNIYSQLQIDEMPKLVALRIYGNDESIEETIGS